METGGGKFGYEDPDLDNRLDHDDDYDEEQEVERTQPFQPGTASTPYQPGAPYHVGEQMEMRTMQHEQSGLPDPSYQEETPLLERTPSISDLQKESYLRQKLKKAVDMIKDKFPKANFEKISIRRGTGKNEGKIVAVGSKKGEYKILKDDESGLMKTFLDSLKDQLGPMAEEIIPEDCDTIRETRQSLREAEIQLEQAETLSSQREEEKKEVEVLRRKIEQTDAQIVAIQDKQGLNLESEAELRRLEQLKKNYQTDLENKKKELDSLTKQARNREKEQAKVDRLRASLAAKESETNTMEERLNQTKTLDDLKEQESELQCQNEEDQAIIQDENASPSDKEAAEGRVAERNKELARLQTQIAERERGQPLLERVKEIFKKNGVTLTAVLLATGVTIRVVIGALTNTLKATGKALGNKVKDIGVKLGSLLPGLIGSIVSFLFKAAGQAIGFLAEHTWLLILAAVAFLFEQYLNKWR